MRVCEFGMIGIPNSAFALDGTPLPGDDALTQEINVLALVKGEERYVFLYADEHKSEVLRTLGRFASNPELSFTWYDAAVLSQRIRQESQVQAKVPSGDFMLREKDE
jgi:hypothetical protein